MKQTGSWKSAWGKISGLVGNLSIGSTATGGHKYQHCWYLQLSASKPTNCRLAGYFCVTQSCSEHDRVAGKSCIHCFPPGTCEEQGRSVYHCFSVPVLYRAVHPLRGGLNCAKNYYWDKHTHHRKSCNFHRIPLQFIQCTPRQKCFAGSDKSLSLCCAKNVLGDVLITEQKKD